ncbi:hypothetical protein MKW94_020895 [Papaver nudicaule]|uniref:Uncharacterized protein n=1 Tax=Papaver nudicaule TaxID=74823 RepID=A0AA42ASL6_PAPNU|nr:hypothetical protein [Papaver nudicaule]
MKEVQSFHHCPSNLSSAILSSSTVLRIYPPLLPSKSIVSPKVSLNKICSSLKSPNKQTGISLTSILRVIPDWADGIKEERMQKKRSLYSHEDWVQHRSSLRHVRHFMSSLSSRVVLSLFPPVIAFTSVAAVVATYNSAVSTWHLLPDFFPILRASPLPYQLTAPALALLLVFRTEASYSRYEEGRKAWTKVIAGTSEFARQVIASVGSTDDDTNTPLKNALLQYIMAFPVALKCQVIYGSDFVKDLQNLLDKDDLEVILNASHRPRCIIEFISQTIQLLHLEESKRTVLESKVSCLHEGIGICEQLMGIPIPLSYTRLTSRFLVLWHLTLPIILWDDCNWIVVPATFISAASLFCIEEVGVLIEEPFPMLALDEVCDMLHDSIRESITNEKLIKGQLLAKKKCTSSSTNNGSMRRSMIGRPNS